MSALSPSLEIKLGLDASGVQKGLGMARSELGQLDASVEKTGGHLGKLKGILSGALGSLGGVGTVAGGVLGADVVSKGVEIIKDGIHEVIGEAEQLQQTQLKTNAVFGEGAEGVTKWAEGAATSLGLTNGEAQKLADSFGLLFKNIGIDAKDLPQMSEQMAAIVANVSAFNNTDPTATAKAFQSALAGNYRGLKSQGIIITNNDVALEAYAETGIKNTKLLTAQQLEQARYNVILEKTGFATGAVTARAKTLAGAEKILHAEMGNLREEIGLKLIPVLTFLTIGATKLLGVFARLMNVAIFPLINAFGKLLAPAFSLVGAGFGKVSNLASRAIGSIRKTYDDFRKSTFEKFIPMLSGFGGVITQSTKGMTKLEAGLMTVGVVLKKLTGIDALGFFRTLGESVNTAGATFDWFSKHGVNPVTAALEALGGFLGDMGLGGPARFITGIAEALRSAVAIFNTSRKIGIGFFDSLGVAAGNFFFKLHTGIGIVDAVLAALNAGVQWLIGAFRKATMFVKDFTHFLALVAKGGAVSTDQFKKLGIPLRSLLLIGGQVVNLVRRFLVIWNQLGALAAFKSLPLSIRMIGRAFAILLRSLGLDNTARAVKQFFYDLSYLVKNAVKLVDDLVHGQWTRAWADFQKVATQAGKLWLDNWRAQIALVKDLFNLIPWSAIGDLVQKGLQGALDFGTWALNVGVPVIAGWLADLVSDAWGALKTAAGFVGGVAAELGDWTLAVAMPKITGWLVIFADDAWTALKAAGRFVGGLVADLGDWTLNVAVPTVAYAAGVSLDSIKTAIHDKITPMAVDMGGWTLNIGAPKIVFVGTFGAAEVAKEIAHLLVDTKVGLVSWILAVGIPVSITIGPLLVPYVAAYLLEKLGVIGLVKWTLKIAEAPVMALQRAGLIEDAVKGFVVAQNIVADLVTWTLNLGKPLIPSLGGFAGFINFSIWIAESLPIIGPIVKLAKWTLNLDPPHISFPDVVGDVKAWWDGVTSAISSLFGGGGGSGGSMADVPGHGEGSGSSLWDNLISALTPDLSGIGFPSLPDWVTDPIDKIPGLHTLIDGLGKAAGLVQAGWDKIFGINDSEGGHKPPVDLSKGMATGAGFSLAPGGFGPPTVIGPVHVGADGNIVDQNGNVVSALPKQPFVGPPLTIKVPVTVSLAYKLDKAASGDPLGRNGAEPGFGAKDLTITATFKADDGDVAKKYTDVMTWGGLWATSSFTGMFLGDDGDVAKKYTDVETWGGIWGSSSFTGQFLADDGDAAIKYSDVMTWGNIWGGSIFTAQFAADNGPAAVAYTDAFSWGDTWAGQVFTATFSIDTSPLYDALNTVWLISQEISDLLPHSPAKKGPLSKPVSFGHIHEALVRDLAGMPDAAAESMGGVQDVLARSVTLASRSGMGTQGAARGGDVHIHIAGNNHADDAFLEKMVHRLGPALGAALRKRRVALGVQR